QHERAVREAYAEDDALEAQVGREPEPRRGADEPEETEELDRAGREAGEELDGQEVEQHAERAREAVLGGAERARAVVDLDLRHARAEIGGERRDEAVQLAVEAELLGDRGAHGAQRAAVVVPPRARDERAQAVRDLRGKPASEPRIA